MDHYAERTVTQGELRECFIKPSTDQVVRHFKKYINLYHKNKNNNYLAFKGENSLKHIII